MKFGNGSTNASTTPVPVVLPLAINQSSTSFAFDGRPYWNCALNKVIKLLDLKVDHEDYKFIQGSVHVLCTYRISPPASGNSSTDDQGDWSFPTRQTNRCRRSSIA